jgi:CheY-like chemotaxis protein
MALVGPRTILVVEDEPLVRELLVDCLQAAGYLVQEAVDGAEAIDLLGQRSPDLILLDMMLPQVDGLGVLRHLAARGAPSPVVAMSASPTALTTAREAGVATTLGKPFELDRLLALVAQHCPH